MTDPNNGSKLKYVEQRLDHLEIRFENFFPKFIQTANDVAWLKKFFWIVATTSVTASITGIINLLNNVK